MASSKRARCLCALAHNSRNQGTIGKPRVSQRALPLHAFLWRMRDFPVNRCPGTAFRLEEGEMERIERITICHCWNGSEDICDVNDFDGRGS